MCIYGKLGAKKTLIADYQNTKQFWENKSILREQFNFENKSWERLLEDLQSNVLRMLVKNITYIELIGVEFVSKLKSGRIVSDIPLPSDSRTIYLNLPIQRRLASRRDIDLCHDHSVYKYVSVLNFSSTDFRRELNKKGKFKWIWGELVLFHIWGELVLGERTFDGILAKARQNFFMKRPQRSFNWREIRLMKHLSKTALWSWRANRWKMFNSRNVKEKIIMDWHCAFCRSFSES